MKYKYLIYFLLIFISVVIFINPTKNFPINDDWDNQLQVLAFRNGDYRIHAAIDASFILQPWIGFLWSFIFGYSFFSLRVLTIIFSILLSLILYLILKDEVEDKSIFFVLCMFMLHPLILHSSLTFMTEIYFLFGVALSYYFFNLYLKDNNLKLLIVSSIILGLTILFRQLAVVSLIAYLIALYLKRKLKLKTFLLTSLPVIAGIIIWQIYPRAGVSEEFIYSFVEPKHLKTRLIDMLHILPLIGFTISPIFFVWKKGNKYLKLALVVASILISTLIYKVDVLPLGNVFYLECILCRTKYRQIFSLFDNVVFKYLYSFIISFSLVNFGAFLVEFIKNKGLKDEVLLTFLILGYFSILIFPEDIYDRYAVAGLMFLIILIVKRLKKRFSVFGLVLMLIVSLFLNFEFYRVSETIYDQVLFLKQEYGYVTSVYSFDVYIKYLATLENKDYVGENDSDYRPTEYICYVQNYTKESDTKLFRFFDSIEKSIDEKFSNPQIFGRDKKTGVRWIKNYDDILIQNVEYPSLIFNPVGRRAFVGTYCVDPSE